MRLTILAALLFTACGTGSGSTVLSEDPNAGAGDDDIIEDTGADDTDADDTGSGDDGGEDTEEPEPSIEDWEGDWIGLVTIESVGESYGFTNCEGELAIDIDADGEATGDGVCTGDDGGWGGSDSYDVEFEGEMNAEGELVGMLYVEAGYWGTVENEVSAAGDGDVIEGSFDGYVEYDSWGGTYTLELDGTFELDRD